MGQFTQNTVCIVLWLVQHFVQKCSICVKTSSPFKQTCQNLAYCPIPLPPYHIFNAKMCFVHLKHHGTFSAFCNEHPALCSIWVLEQLVSSWSFVGSSWFRWLTSCTTSWWRPGWAGEPSWTSKKLFTMFQKPAWPPYAIWPGFPSRAVSEKPSHADSTGGYGWLHALTVPVGHYFMPAKTYRVIQNSF